MPIDRSDLNDALSTMLAGMGISRISDDNLDELTHRTADFLDEVEANND